MRHDTMKILILVLISALLSGCGGGGGEEDASLPPPSNPASNPASNPPIKVESVSEEILITMAELSIPDNFSYQNTTQINIQIELERLAEDQAHAAVYGDYITLPSGNYKPVRTSRVASGPLNRGYLELSFSLKNETNQFLVEIWVVGIEEPTQSVFVKENNVAW